MNVKAPEKIGSTSDGLVASTASKAQIGANRTDVSGATETTPLIGFAAINSAAVGNGISCSTEVRRAGIRLSRGGVPR